MGGGWLWNLHICYSLWTDRQAQSCERYMHLIQACTTHSVGSLIADDWDNRRWQTECNKATALPSMQPAAWRRRGKGIDAIVPLRPIRLSVCLSGNRDVLPCAKSWSFTQNQSHRPGVALSLSLSPKNFQSLIKSS